MGIRAWLTPVDSYNDFNKAIESIETNPYSIGVNFILQLNKDIDVFTANTILIAWTGDGLTSLKKLRPMHLRDETWLLDNLDETYRTEPYTLGNMYESTDEITGEMFKP